MKRSRTLDRGTVIDKLAKQAAQRGRLGKLARFRSKVMSPAYRRRYALLGFATWRWEAAFNRAYPSDPFAKE